MLTLNVECTGKSTEDILEALDVIRAKVESGFTSGFDKGDGRSYNFEVDGEEESSEEE